MPHFDWTISLGTILQLMIVLGALYRMLRTLFLRIEQRMLAMEHRVDVMWAWTMTSMTPTQRADFEVFYRQWRDHMAEDVGIGVPRRI